MSAAGAGDAVEDRRCRITALVANEQTVFAIKANSLHFPLASIIVCRHGTISREDVQFFPLTVA